MYHPEVSEEALINEKMRILIAYDSSDGAKAALDDLRWAGLPRTAEALVVSVAELWLPPPPSGDESVDASFPLYVPAGSKRAREKVTHAVEGARSGCGSGRTCAGCFPGVGGALRSLRGFARMGSDQGSR